MSDIVESLNNANLDGTGSVKIDMLCVEAADEIVRLRKHIALDEIGNKAIQDLWAIDREDLAKAEAERDRLRDALKGVLGAYHLDGDGQPPCFGRPSIRRAWDAVRAALGDKP